MSTSIDLLPNENSNSNIKLEIKDKKTTPSQSKQPIQPTQSSFTELSKESINQIVSGIQEASQARLTELPSRDIPMNTQQVALDPNVQPNYIPPEPENDYIKNKETYKDVIKKVEYSNSEINNLDNLYSELQTPILIMVIYFLFQLPYTKELFVKYAPSLFNKDGNQNFSGYVITTLMFGLSYYIVIKFTNYLTEI
tara:strand:- start:11 stop:598 length:588 start_codon:yes stop_codon:yes gene_type:complete